MTLYYNKRQVKGKPGIDGMSKTDLQRIVEYYGYPTRGCRDDLIFRIHLVQRDYGVSYTDLMYIAIFLKHQMAFEWHPQANFYLPRYQIGIIYRSKLVDPRSNSDFTQTEYLPDDSLRTLMIPADYIDIDTIEEYLLRELV